jgi:hypothetical protein
MTSHFKMRASQRGFTSPEALQVLRHGKVQGSPEFCAEFCNWKFMMAGKHDYGRLFVVAGVSAGDQRQIWSSGVVLITGFLRC